MYLNYIHLLNKEIIIQTIQKLPFPLVLNMDYVCVARVSYIKYIMFGNSGNFLRLLSTHAMQILLSSDNETVKLYLYPLLFLFLVFNRLYSNSSYLQLLIKFFIIRTKRKPLRRSLVFDINTTENHLKAKLSVHIIGLEESLKF